LPMLGSGCRPNASDNVHGLDVDSKERIFLGGDFSKERIFVGGHLRSDRQTASNMQLRLDVQQSGPKHDSPETENVELSCI
jgi:hypothetical protein